MGGKAKGWIEQGQKRGSEPMEKQETNEYIKKIKKHKKRIRFSVLAGIVSIILIAVIINIIIRNKKYDSYRIMAEYAMDDMVGGEYYNFGDYVLKYSNDGICCLKGKTPVWNQAFDMQNPVMDICGEYVAIGEKNTNKIYVFNTEGQQGEINTQYPLVNLAVAQQGVVAAVLEADDANYIELTDTSGTELVTGRTVLNGDGYPIDLSLSDDGTKLMVSYLKVDEEQCKTSVAFYNFSEVGKNEIDRLMAGFNQYDTAVVPKVEFLNNDTACAFADDRFTIYTMKQKPEQVCEEIIEEKIKSIFYDDSYIGLVLNNENVENPNTLKVYNLKGSKVLSVDFDFAYTDIKFAQESIVMYNDEECVVMSMKGVQKYRATFTNGIIDILPSKNAYEYLLMDIDGIKKIKLK